MLHKIKDTLKEYSPELGLGMGILLGMAGAVMLAKGHKSIDLSQEVEEVEYIRDNIDDPESGVDIKEARKDLVKQYGSVGKKVGKAYGVPVALGVGSMYCLLSSHIVLKNRNRVLVASLNALMLAFQQYRNRVVEEQGGEADNRYMYGYETVRKTNVIVGDDGKKKKQEVEEQRFPENRSDGLYDRYFDSTCPSWVNDKEMNLFFLRGVEQQMNDVLNSSKKGGTVVLNDVYDALGFPRTSIGAVAGWSHKIEGDDFIDFGLDSPANNINTTNEFHLVFNVNGTVFKAYDEKG